MRDPKRIDRFVELLRLYWKRYPDLRFGQIAVILAGSDDPFHVEDDIAEKSLTSELWKADQDE